MVPRPKSGYRPLTSTCFSSLGGWAAGKVISMNQSSLWIAGAVALGVSQAFAQSQAGPGSTQLASLDPVVVSAARIQQSLSDVIPSVSVITREDIERSAAPTLIDLLQGEAGVEIGRNGGPGTVSSIFLRGQNSVSSAVFIDGVRAQVDQIGAIKLIDIPLSLIERVEILRGNVGALYGESAIGGVINIYTREASGPPRAYGSLGLGSRNTSDMSVGLGGQAEAFRFQVNLQRYETDGFSAMDPKQNSRVNPDRDGFRRESVYARLDHDVTRTVSIGLTGHVIRSRVGFDNGFSPNIATDTHQLDNSSADLTLFSRIKLTPDWTSRISLTNSDLRYKDYRNGVQLAEFSGGRTEGEQNSLRWDNTSALGAGHLVFGAESNRSRFLSYGTSHDRESSGAYAGYSGRWMRLDYQANVRYDEVIGKADQARAANNATTWLAGAGLIVTDALRLTGAVSTAFRAPATGELYGYGGNPNLRPEEHQSQEAGLVLKTGPGLLRLVRFHTETTNAIVYATSSYSNVGRVNNEGYELTYAASYQRLRLKLAAVSQDPRNAETGARLARRAKEYGSADVSSQFGRMELGARLIVSGDRPDFGQSLSGYTLFNLYSSLRLAKDWVARLKVENAFDERYQLVYGYNTPPRGVFLSLSYQPLN